MKLSLEEEPPRCRVHREPLVKYVLAEEEAVTLPTYDSPQGRIKTCRESGLTFWQMLKRLVKRGGLARRCPSGRTPSDLVTWDKVTGLRASEEGILGVWSFVPNNDDLGATDWEWWKRTPLDEDGVTP